MYTCLNYKFKFSNPNDCIPANPSSNLYSAITQFWIFVTKTDQSIFGKIAVLNFEEVVLNTL